MTYYNHVWENPTSGKMSPCSLRATIGEDAIIRLPAEEVNEWDQGEAQLIVSATQVKLKEIQ